MQDFLDEFVSPLGVAVITLIVGTIVKFFNDRRKSNNLKIATLDSFLIHLQKTSSVLNDLKNDAEDNYYEYRNRKLAQEISSSLQSYTKDSSSIYNNNLRKEILNEIEKFKFLVEEISFFESYASSKVTENESAKTKLLADLRGLEIEAFKYNIIFNTNKAEFKGINKMNLQLVKAFNEHYQRINTNYTKVDQDLNDNYKFNKDKRVWFAIKIVDTQNTVNTIISKIEKERGK